MAAAEARRDALVTELSAGRSDHVTRAATANALAGAEVDLACAEGRWLALAEELGA